MYSFYQCFQIPLFTHVYNFLSRNNNNPENYPGIANPRDLNRYIRAPTAARPELTSQTNQNLKDLYLIEIRKKEKKHKQELEELKALSKSTIKPPDYKTRLTLKMKSIKQLESDLNNYRSQLQKIEQLEEEQKKIQLQAETNKFLQDNLTSMKNTLGGIVKSDPATLAAEQAELIRKANETSEYISTPLETDSTDEVDLEMFLSQYDEPPVKSTSTNPLDEIFDSLKAEENTTRPQSRRVKFAEQMIAT